MWKPRFGICICHNEQRLIVVKKGYCAEGNHEQKQEKKKASGKKPSKSFQSYSFKEPTGEAQMFEEIAAEREWVCYVTGVPLKELTPTSFLHVLPKALNRYPKFKLYKKNVVLGTDEIHFKWDKSPRSELKNDHRFDKLFALEEELKNEYKQLYGKHTRNT